MKNKLLVIGLSLLLSVNLFAVDFSEIERKEFEELQNFRLSLSVLNDNKIAVKQIEEKYEKLVANQALYSEEYFLTVENILTWEKYNYLYEEDLKHPDLEPLITNQYRKIREYTGSHKQETYSEWFYETAADIVAQTLQFLSLSKIMSEGLTVKKYYDEALTINPNSAFALMNIAQWYYYAPGVSGGGKNKARRALEESVKNSVTVVEKFYTTAMLSQIYFDNGDKEKAAELLEQAEALCPGTAHLKKFRFINAKDCSYFSYVTDREKLEKKWGVAGQHGNYGAPQRG